MIAYAADPRVRADVLHRYRVRADDPAAAQYIADKLISPSPIYWVTGTGDTEAFVEQTGFPEELARLMPMLTARLGKEGKTEGLRWLTCAAAGADLTLVGTQIVLATLEELELRVLFTKTEESRAIYLKLLDFHRAELEGEQRSPADWRQLRKDAVALLEAMQADGPALSMLATAAWPVRRAKELLEDLFAAETRIFFIVAGERLNMSEVRDGDAGLKASLTRERIDAGASPEEAAAAVEAHLAEHRPDLLARERSLKIIQTNVLPAVAKNMSNRLTKALSAAPVPAASPPTEILSEGIA